MEISDDKFVALFEDVRATRERLDALSSRLNDVLDLLEAGQRHLRAQIESYRRRVDELDRRSAGDRRFLRGVGVGVSLVSGGIGSGATLLVHWLAKR